jgi:hypothetical protein
MTALKDYVRLEATALWRASPEAAPRTVGVTFGDATLVVTDDEGGPLSHWSLPAVRRLNPGEAPARYAPDGGGEALEIEDGTLTEAIERVRASLSPRGPARGRRLLLGVALALLLGPAVVLGPGLLRDRALADLPASKRAEIGATLLGHLQRDLGPACRDLEALPALEALRARAMGAAGQAVVLPEGPAHPLLLPGGIVVVSRAAVEGASEPAALAGHLIAAGTGDPLRPLLEEAGPLATLRLLATGRLSGGTLAAHAARLLADPPPPPPPEALLPAFAAAGLPMGPYRAALAPPTAAPLPAPPEVTPDVIPDVAPQGAPLVPDADWISLQGICR